MRVDYSTFMGAMAVYAVIKCDREEERKSDVVKGTHVKFKNASFAFRTTAHEHLVELLLYS